MRGLVLVDNRSNSYHLKEGSGSLLHSGPTRCRQGDYRKSLRRRAANCRDNPLTRRDTDRASHEAELTEYKSDIPALHRGPTSRNGFVCSRRSAGTAQFSLVLGICIGVKRRFIPALPRTRIYD